MARHTPDNLIQRQLNRQTKPKDKGGDRKSKKYRE